MALQVSFTDPVNGVPAAASYVRVDPPTVPTKVTITRYYDATAAADKAPIQSRDFSIPPAVQAQIQAAIIARVYTYLKTLPEFNGAIDV